MMRAWVGGRVSLYGVPFWDATRCGSDLQLESKLSTFTNFDVVCIRLFELRPVLETGEE